MDRPRYRRKDPQRTGPIRNAREALRDGDPWQGSTWQRDDDASNGVREGYRVIDEQIRRGRRMAQELDDGEPWRDPRYGRERRRRPSYERDDRYEEDRWRRERRDRFTLLEMPLRHIEILAREILRQIGSGRPNPLKLAELILRLQLEMCSELARFGFSIFGGLTNSLEDRFEEDVERVERDIDETLDEIEEEIWEEEEELFDWPPMPSTLVTINYSNVPIPIYVVSHKPTEIGLDLPAGAQSLDLEVEPVLVSGSTHIHPITPVSAFEAEFVALVDGPLILRIEVPRELPDGKYLRRILDCATGEPVGSLTVQVGTIPPSAAPEAAPKRRKKR